MPIEKVLIANRGEIACRIIRTCRKLGIATVAVYSEADADALHVDLADTAHGIGPAPAQQSYLDMDAVLRATGESGADAIHPGYGFLSENAGFARATQKAGFSWIGPAPETIKAMGDKQRARSLAVACGVPVLPGSAPESFSETEQAIGYPVLVKAAAGGGGIGMRIAVSQGELAKQIETTQSHAERSFGNPTVYLERYVPNARHVEVQIFGFGDGTAVHLFDRDCTIQRRFQKIIEEAPAPGLPDTIRRQMHDAALALVREQRYLDAGTVEFIYDCDREEIYFLEMNTRIQVEHAATEMITGIDIVRWQIEAAAGVFCATRQEDQSLVGHALECRIYAERPEKNFLPSPGELSRLKFPDEASDLRIDTGVREGDSITPYYDPMLAKVIASGADRTASIERMRRALLDTEIEGIGTNLDFLLEVLGDPNFQSANVTTRYVEKRQERLKEAALTTTGLSA